MKDFHISVTKVTDQELLQEACETTFLGKSKASLSTIYKSEHSPARTQMFWIKLKQIPLFVSTHLIRHHVGSVPFQLTCRNDRTGGNPQVAKRCQDIAYRLNISNDLIDDNQLDDAQGVIATTVEEIEWIGANTDRYTPVNLSLFVNAQSLIDMSKLRLCLQAHTETITVFKKIKQEISKVDPDLAKNMVRKCVYRGGLCGEPKCCGYNKTSAFKAELKDYVSIFNEKQKGLIKISD